MTDNALELIDVVKKFDDVVAVDGVTLSVRRGEFFSLLGPSGCGKTTTLRMVAGFEEPTSGQLLLDGQEASQIPPFRRSTNLVFQSYALFPHMTVFDNVAFGPRRAKVAKAEVRRRVGAALATVRMDHLADRLPRQLSGGQQQRVGLARALVNEPSVLLLDEPLGALDLKLRQEMQTELKRIQREVGICFIYVTHDQEEALTMSDRIAVMNRGRVEQLGTPEDIYLHPRTPFVADFIGKANLIPCEVVASGPGVAEVAVVGGTRIPVPHSTVEANSVGQVATLVLRPEHLAVTADEPDGPCALRAKVTEVVFQGSAIRYDLTDDQGTVLTAVMPAEEPERRVDLGALVWLGWRPEAAHLILDGGEE